MVGVFAPDLRSGQLHRPVADAPNGQVAADRHGFVDVGYLGHLRGHPLEIRFRAGAGAFAFRATLTIVVSRTDVNIPTVTTAAMIFTSLSSGFVPGRSVMVPGERSR